MSYIYSYWGDISKKFSDLKEKLKSGKIIPHQVEIHPPPKGKKLCWLRCKYCYTQTDIGEKQRISGDRLVAIIKEIGRGSPKTAEKPEKIIFSGFRTDPLNSCTLVDLLEEAKNCRFITGIHTKGLVLTPRLIDVLNGNNLEGDYISFSIDAGNNETYNLVHGICNPESRIYDRVKRNIGRLMEKLKESKSNLQVRATYLLTRDNCTRQQVLNFVQTFNELGIDTIRFSVPIYPMMGKQKRKNDFPTISANDIDDFESVFSQLNQKDNRLIYLKFKSNIQRILPCWSRLLSPTISYDGYLYPCCLVASKEFDLLRIADLKKEGFWDAYYKKMYLDYVAANCQCDRAAAEINRGINSYAKKVGMERDDVYLNNKN